MIKNRLTQVVFQTVYVVLGVFGIMASTGYFKQALAPYFYIYYTNISNYLCVMFMFVSLIITIVLLTAGAFFLSGIAKKFKDRQEKKEFLQNQGVVIEQQEENEK